MSAFESPDLYETKEDRKRQRRAALQELIEIYGKLQAAPPDLSSLTGDPRPLPTLSSAPLHTTAEATAGEEEQNYEERLERIIREDDEKNYRFLFHHHQQQHYQQQQQQQQQNSQGSQSVELSSNNNNNNNNSSRSYDCVVPGFEYTKGSLFYSINYEIVCKKARDIRDTAPCWNLMLQWVQAAHQGGVTTTAAASSSSSHNNNSSSSARAVARRGFVGSGFHDGYKLWIQGILYYYEGRMHRALIRADAEHYVRFAPELYAPLASRRGHASNYYYYSNNNNDNNSNSNTYSMRDILEMRRTLDVTAEDYVSVSGTNNNGSGPLAGGAGGGVGAHTGGGGGGGLYRAELTSADLIEITHRARRFLTFFSNGGNNNNNSSNSIVHTASFRSGLQDMRDYRSTLRYLGFVLCLLHSPSSSSNPNSVFAAYSSSLALQQNNNNNVAAGGGGGGGVAGVSRRFRHLYNNESNNSNNAEAAAEAGIQMAASVIQTNMHRPSWVVDRVVYLFAILQLRMPLEVECLSFTEGKLNTNNNNSNNDNNSRQSNHASYSSSLPKNGNGSDNQGSTGAAAYTAEPFHGNNSGSVPAQQQGQMQEKKSVEGGGVQKQQQQQRQQQQQQLVHLQKQRQELRENDEWLRARLADCCSLMAMSLPPRVYEDFMFELMFQQTQEAAASRFDIAGRARRVSLLQQTMLAAATAGAAASSSSSSSFLSSDALGTDSGFRHANTMAANGGSRLDGNTTGNGHDTATHHNNSDGCHPAHGGNANGNGENGNENGNGAVSGEIRAAVTAALRQCRAALDCQRQAIAQMEKDYDLLVRVVPAFLKSVGETAAAVLPTTTAAASAVPLALTLLFRMSRFASVEASAHPAYASPSPHSPLFSPSTAHGSAPSSSAADAAASAAAPRQNTRGNKWERVPIAPSKDPERVACDLTELLRPLVLFLVRQLLHLAEPPSFSSSSSASASAYDSAGVPFTSAPSGSNVEEAEAVSAAEERLAFVSRAYGIDIYDNSNNNNSTHPSKEGIIEYTSANTAGGAAALGGGTAGFASSAFSSFQHMPSVKSSGKEKQTSAQTTTTAKTLSPAMSAAQETIDYVLGASGPFASLAALRTPLPAGAPGSLTTATTTTAQEASDRSATNAPVAPPSSVPAAELEAQARRAAQRLRELARALEAHYTAAPMHVSGAKWPRAFLTGFQSREALGEICFKTALKEALEAAVEEMHTRALLPQSTATPTSSIVERVMGLMGAEGHGNDSDASTTSATFGKRNSTGCAAAATATTGVDGKKNSSSEEALLPLLQHLLNVEEGWADLTVAATAAVGAVGASASPGSPVSTRYSPASPSSPLAYNAAAGNSNNNNNNNNTVHAVSGVYGSAMDASNYNNNNNRTANGHSNGSHNMGNTLMNGEEANAAAIPQSVNLLEAARPLLYDAIRSFFIKHYSSSNSVILVVPMVNTINWALWLSYRPAPPAQPLRAKKAMPPPPPPLSSKSATKQPHNLQQVPGSAAPASSVSQPQQQRQMNLAPPHQHQHQHSMSSTSTNNLRCVVRRGLPGVLGAVRLSGFLVSQDHFCSLYVRAAVARLQYRPSPAHKNGEEEFLRRRREAERRALEELRARGGAVEEQMALLESVLSGMTEKTVSSEKVTAALLASSSSSPLSSSVAAAAAAGNSFSGGGDVGAGATTTTVAEAGAAVNSATAVNIVPPPAAGSEASGEGAAPGTSAPAAATAAPSLAATILPYKARAHVTLETFSPDDPNSPHPLNSTSQTNNNNNNNTAGAKAGSSEAAAAAAAISATLHRLCPPLATAQRLLRESYEAERRGATLAWAAAAGRGSYVTFQLRYPRDGGRPVTVHGTPRALHLFSVIAGGGRRGVALGDVAAAVDASVEEVVRELEPALKRELLILNPQQQQQQKEHQEKEKDAGLPTTTTTNTNTNITTTSANTTNASTVDNRSSITPAPPPPPSAPHSAPRPSLPPAVVSEATPVALNYAFVRRRPGQDVCEMWERPLERVAPPDPREAALLADEQLRACEAAIVRALKARRRMTLGELVDAVREMIGRRVEVSARRVKNGTEALLERNYVRRAPGEQHVFEYVA